MGIALSKTGEVADFLDADQMQPGKSQFECGFFAVAICRAMAQVGKPPTQSVAQIIAEAEQWYAQYDGSNAISNTDGMTLVQLYDLLHQVGLHYQATATSIATVKAWLAVGYPVIVAVPEVSVHDLELGNANPYPWTPAGTHIIVATGVAQDGNLLVRDTANCTNLYDPGSLRPGPRTYDASQLQLVSATVCVPAWAARPASATPPATPPAPLDAPPPVDWVLQSAIDTWQASIGWDGGPPSRNNNIWLKYLEEYRAGKNHGVPIRGWSSHDDHGRAIAVMEFTNGRAEDQNGSVTFIY